MAEEQRKETASQKYRRKLKENPEVYADHLCQERARDSKRREEMTRKMEVDKDLKILDRIRSKERMQATRKRRKEEQIQQTGTRYSSPRTLGKAVAKVKRNLPASPTKAVEVVKKIAAEFQVAASDKNAPKEVPRKLTNEVKEQICNFYNRDDISRQMPGMKDVKSINDEDGEVRVQFLTTVDGKHFTEIVNDIADVRFEDIIAKLEAPEKKIDGKNTLVEFSANIDVFEKK